MTQCILERVKHKYISWISLAHNQVTGFGHQLQNNKLPDEVGKICQKILAQNNLDCSRSVPVIRSVYRPKTHLPSIK